MIIYLNYNDVDENLNTKNYAAEMTWVPDYIKANPDFHGNWTLSDWVCDVAVPIKERFGYSYDVYVGFYKHKPKMVIRIEVNTDKVDIETKDNIEYAVTLLMSEIKKKEKINLKYEIEVVAKGD